MLISIELCGWAEQRLLRYAQVRWQSLRFAARSKDLRRIRCISKVATPPSACWRVPSEVPKSEMLKRLLRRSTLSWRRPSEAAIAQEEYVELEHSDWSTLSWRSELEHSELEHVELEHSWQGAFRQCCLDKFDCELR